MLLILWVLIEFIVLINSELLHTATAPLLSVQPCLPDQVTHSSSSLIFHSRNHKQAHVLMNWLTQRATPSQTSKLQQCNTFYCISHQLHINCVVDKLINCTFTRVTVMFLPSFYTDNEYVPNSDSYITVYVYFTYTVNITYSNVIFIVHVKQTYLHKY